MQITQIDIDQALHGYSEGHRLLASSTEINKEAHRTMLVLSDMSGPSMQDGFEEYITGYPLNNGGCYAFSKTWFAPEMSRPGCVWTHTLILSKETLSSLEDLHVLLSLFKRPKSQLDFSAYTEKIRYQQIQHVVETSRSALHLLTSTILSELYGYEKDYPVALISEEPLIFEDTIVAIWSQQWPALRQRFTFCSGAMHIRLVNGKPFSFQIIPFKQRRQFEREIKDLRFVGNKLPPENEKAWIKELVEDVPATTLTPLRAFLRIFGGSVRHHMSKLTIFYFEHRSLPANRAGATDVINLFYRLFPNANKSIPELVRRILGRRLGKRESELLGVSEYDMLLGLATYDDGNILDPRFIDTNARALQLFKEDKPKAIILMSHIIENRLTRIGQEMLQGFASIISAEDLIDISNSHRDLLFALAAVEPGLIAKPAVWRIAHSEQLTLLDAISIDKLSDVAMSSLIAGIIEAGISSISDEIFRKFGCRAVDSLLEFIDTHGSLPGDTLEWSRLLRHNPGTTIEWLKKHSLKSVKTLAFVAIGLEARGEIATKENVSLWARLLRQFKNDIDSPDAIALSYFLMPIALANSGQDANYIAKFSFPYIHDALLKNQLDWRIWKLLEPLLPELPWHWFRSWDKCERLRMAMKERGLQDVLEGNVM
jgi:hypothetical protein